MSRILVGTLLLLGACGAATLPTRLTASPAASPADLIKCTRAKLDTLGFQLTSRDVQENRLTARKIVVNPRRADPRYRRNIDRLEIEAAPAAQGGSSFTVVGRSFAEYETTRGPTEEEEGASAELKQSAQAIVDACAGSP